MSGPSSPRRLPDINEQKLLKWIHTNSFPSIETHQEIANKLTPVIQRRIIEHIGILLSDEYFEETEQYSSSTKGLRHFAKSDENPGMLSWYLYATRKIPLVMIDVFSHYNMHTMLDYDIFSMINHEYNKRGYFYRYFGWVNVNFDPVAAKLINLDITDEGFYRGLYDKFSIESSELHSDNFKYGPLEVDMIKQVKRRLKLTPDTFEQGFPQLTLGSYKRVIKAIDEGSATE